MDYNTDGVDEITEDNFTVLLERYTFEGRWHHDSNQRETYLDAWDEIVKIYDKFPKAHTTKISHSEGTALHVAVDLNKQEFVVKLVEATIKHGTVDGALRMVNEHGDTPLHVAASRGFARICKLLIGENIERMDLMSLKNKQGETPLFQAAINWQKQAFAYLGHISRDYVVLGDLVRNDGDSILHCAIEREFFDLAVIIVHYYDFLSTHINEKGSTPLKVLATKPTAFRSGSNLSWWKNFVYKCIPVQSLEPESTMIWNLMRMDQSRSDKNKMNFPENYATLYELFSRSLSFLLGNSQRDPENPPSNGGVRCTVEAGCQLVSPTDRKVGFLPPNYATIRQFVKSAYVHILGLLGVELMAVQKMKQSHKWSNQLLKVLMQTPYSAFTGAGGLPGIAVSSVDEDMLIQLSKCSTKPSIIDEDMLRQHIQWEQSKENPFIVAASNGIVEMVNEILNLIPNAILTNSKKENVLLVAVKNRQPIVVETIRMRMMNDKMDIWNNLTLGVDEEGNTMLHLAAKALSEDKPWQMSGSALQMMWDITWFQYIKSFVPKHFYFRFNKGKKTAGEIFRESHKDLVKNSAEWLKDTSESCSVVAALVAGVSFATTSAVPGDYNDQGRPRLEGYTTFDVFVISALIGLCFSVTGLIMFLSILTSRKEARDFRRDLPIKILLGLSSIFVSIAAMFVSFCTGQVFLLNGKYRKLLIPIYAATSLPITLYAIAQFPLYIDLILGIFTKVPMARDKGDKL